MRTPSDGVPSSRGQLFATEVCVRTLVASSILLLAVSACVRRQAPAVEGPASSEATSAAVDCALRSVARYGLVVTDRVPGRPTFVARTRADEPGSPSDPLNGQPVDRLTVRAGGGRLEAHASTAVPRYVEVNGERGVIWTQVATSARARDAEREVPAACSLAGG